MERAAVSGATSQEQTGDVLTSLILRNPRSVIVSKNIPRISDSCYSSRSGFPLIKGENGLPKVVLSRRLGRHGKYSASSASTFLE
jgi:hypothetical protein